MGLHYYNFLARSELIGFVTRKMKLWKSRLQRLLVIWFGIVWLVFSYVFFQALSESILQSQDNKKTILTVDEQRISLEEQTREVTCELLEEKKQLQERILEIDILLYKWGLSYTGELHCEKKQEQVELMLTWKKTVLFWVPKTYASDESEETKYLRRNKIRYKKYSENDYHNLFVNYAYYISSGDMDFVLTLTAENTLRDYQRQSNVYNNWIREQSYWLCMIHRKRHSYIVDNPLFWSDAFRQLDRCLELYKAWTPMYWFNKRRDYFYLFEYL